MFSVQQKRDISDAVQKILRATAHAELPTSGEVSFKLHVDGAEEWSFADIKNNGAIGNPGLNPHNELMASISEEDGRGLIEKAQAVPYVASMRQSPPMPDPRNTPEEFFSGRWLAAYKDMVKAEIQQLVDRMNSLVKSVEGFAQSGVDYQTRIHRLEDRDKIKDALYSELGAQIDKLDNFLTPIMEDNLIQHHSDQLEQLMTSIRQLGTGKAT